MSTTIESLELEIQSNSTGAVKGIDALTQSLTKLRNVAKGGLGLTSVAREISAVGASTGKVTGLAKAIGLLSGTKISSNIATQLNNIGKSLQNLDTTGGREKIDGIVDALSPLSNLGKTSLGSYVTNLKKLPETFAELNKIDMASVTAKVQELAKALKPLADEMQKVANGFSAFPAKIQQFLNENNKIPTSNKNVKTSFTDVFHVIKSGIATIQNYWNKIKSLTEKSREFGETMNLFSVSMGQYAEEAEKYAYKVNAALGIDPAEWMKNQGLFMTLATGFGVAGNEANKMSQELTKLGYDISSFQDISVEEAMQKLQSGLAGELEPLRRIGYDLSQAKLEAVALEMGIGKSVSAMTQAEKAQLRYYAIMTQVTSSHGDLAETIESPANQMRLFETQIQMTSRSIGNMFLPMLGKVLPLMTATAKVIQIAADNLARLMGYTATGARNGTEIIEDSTASIVENLENSQEEAKKLKSYMLGFDELNVINPNNETEDSSSAIFDISSLSVDGWGLTEVSNTTNGIVTKMSEWLGITKEINSWTELLGTRLGGILLVVGGTAIFAFVKSLTGVATVVKKLKDVFGKSGEIAKGGGTSGNIGDIGDTIAKTTTKLKGLVKNLGLGIAVIAEVIAATLLVVGAIWLMGIMLKEVGKAWQPVIDDGKNIAIAIGAGIGLLAIIGTATGLLGSVGTPMVVSMALGIATLALIGVATALFLVEIWALTYPLIEVGKAWQPVIENGKQIALAVGLGFGLLAIIGTAVGLIGSVGAPMVVAMALGVATLALIGAAVALFLVEIWAVTFPLLEVGEAWKPVIEHGEEIASAIGWGMALLIGIGAVTAALGMATVATAGLLPVAIGLGTLMLIELTVAFVAFIESLMIIAKKLTEELHPTLQSAIGALPELIENMREYTSFMGEFAGEVVKYSLASSIAGIAATIDTIVGFFTTDPVSKMSKEVDSQIDQFAHLITGLLVVIPRIIQATELVRQYNEVMGEFDSASGNNGGLLGNLGIAKGAINTVINGIEALANGVIRAINGMITALNSLSFSIPDWIPGLGGKTFGLNLSTIATISIPRFAEGGFPDQGQMFIAREAGAEMVGNIGRRTAVANNDQIVAGIAGGVAEANEEQNVLLREQNSLLRALLEKDTGVYLDGKNLTSSVEKYQRERGRVLVAGGVL